MKIVAFFLVVSLVNGYGEAFDLAKLATSFQSALKDISSTVNTWIQTLVSFKPEDWQSLAQKAMSGDPKVISNIMESFQKGGNVQEAMMKFVESDIGAEMMDKMGPAIMQTAGLMKYANTFNEMKQKAADDKAKEQQEPSGNKAKEQQEPSGNKAKEQKEPTGK